MAEAVGGRQMQHDPELAHSTMADTCLADYWLLVLAGHQKPGKQHAGQEALKRQGEAGCKVRQAGSVTDGQIRHKRQAEKQSGHRPRSAGVEQEDKAKAGSREKSRSGQIAQMQACTYASVCTLELHLHYGQGFPDTKSAFTRIAEQFHA